MLANGLTRNQTTYEIVQEEMIEKGFVPDTEGQLIAVSNGWGDFLMTSQIVTLKKAHAECQDLVV